MKRVVVLGRGGAGKIRFAAQLGDVTSLPVIELDKHFWPPDLVPIPADRWTAIQRGLTAGRRWILDGDLGPYDVLEVRLQLADTVIVLDFPFWRCAWRALRRSRENPAFWSWVVTYRRRSLPVLTAAIVEHARDADVYVLRNPLISIGFLSTSRTPPLDEAPPA
jgi:adenylate kinase family enzyme